MIFRSRRDSYFMTLISVASLILAAVLLLPLFNKEFQTLGSILVMVISFVFCVGIILWGTFDIKYTFSDNYLHIKGGPFRSKIPYEDITKVGPATSMLTGYRILSAKQGIEVHYKTGYWGSVQISPENENLFLNELKSRCPNISIHIKNEPS